MGHIPPEQMSLFTTYHVCYYGNDYKSTAAAVAMYKLTGLLLISSSQLVIRNSWLVSNRLCLRSTRQQLAVFISSSAV